MDDRFFGRKSQRIYVNYRKDLHTASMILKGTVSQVNRSLLDCALVPLKAMPIQVNRRRLGRPKGTHMRKDQNAQGANKAMRDWDVKR